MLEAELSRTADAAVPDSGIGVMLVSARSLDEYRAMFTLSDAALRRRLLDCPGGAASFTAEVNATGGDARACDPIYAHLSAEELAARARADTDCGNSYVRAHPEQYRWSFFTDPDDHQRSRNGAVTRFTADWRAHPERYVLGELPRLPFADDTFDLVLSSHLLFSYADRLDLAFHRDSIGELMRVTRDELRIFPLMAMGAVSYPYFDQLLTQLADQGITTQVIDVDYEFQVGGNQMLVCTHRPD
ncbi:MAG: methyltransferase domain-containing protein [Pseudonocardiaceae bacterium]